MSTPSGTDVAVMHSPTTNTIAVCFRGSEQKCNDWFTNFQVLKTSFDGDSCKVHKGWMTALDEVLDTLLDGDDKFTGLKSLLQQHKPTVYVTGHSLGGALSVLFGTVLAKRMPEYDINVINFGCPRVGNRHFKSMVESLKNLNIVRYVNSRDPVPRLPYFFYKHTGHTVKLRQKKVPLVYMNNRGANLGGWSFFMPFFVNDHSMEGYIEKINRISARDALSESRHGRI